jgi:hypothetical protein
MAVPERDTESAHWLDRLAGRIARSERARFNRRSLGAAGILAVSGVTANEVHSSRARAQTTRESIAILSDAVTAEGLLVTLLGVARTKATDLTLDEATVRLIRAAQCEEAAHFNNLVAAGAAPNTSKYTIADQIFENPTSFLATWMDLERIMVGMYMAASRQVAANGDLDLVEIAYQIGVVEAQHQALIRQLTGERLPADRAFPAWQYRASAEAVVEIRSLGFIGGRGTPYDYPGPGDRYCRGITGLVAETTDDQTPPDVTPAPRREATPNDENSQASPVSNS